jgi:hypothetical protein
MPPPACAWQDISIASLLHCRARAKPSASLEPGPGLDLTEGCFPPGPGTSRITHRVVAYICETTVKSTSRTRLTRRASDWLANQRKERLMENQVTFRFEIRPTSRRLLQNIFHRRDIMQYRNALTIWRFAVQNLAD